MFNDLFFLQTLTLLTLTFFSTVNNILTLWYLGGIYLLSLGLILFYNDIDILVGFLWVIDLGVGLIFFIFILHYSTFMHQKITIVQSYKRTLFLSATILSLLTLFYLLTQPFQHGVCSSSPSAWNFLVSWYDYYDFVTSSSVTELNLLHEIYFNNNSFEFFIINFVILYGIVASILLSFLIKRIFNLATFDQLLNTKQLNSTGSILFIRNQNFITQQSTSAGTGLWLKKKKLDYDK